MRSALIGASGFVGGNLLLQRSFDEMFRSTNIETIRGRSYGLVVCAGAPAAKWIANQDPEADLENLQLLMTCLESVRAESFVLVSTIDVYPDPNGVDEDSPVDPGANHAYGRHRYLLEEFVRDRFAGSVILRLPGLFGPGLKKNAIYDLLNQHEIEKICPDSVYQFYPIRRLWLDTERVLQNHLKLVNIATEPLNMRRVAKEGLGMQLTHDHPGPAATYDMWTRHADILGGQGRYLLDAATVLHEIQDYAARERRGHA